MKKTITNTLFCLGLIFSFTAGAFTVFDGANFAQNTLTAIRNLQGNLNEARQIANQITSIRHEIASLENDAKNLTKLDWNTLSSLENLLYKMGDTYSKASRTFGDLEQMGSKYEKVFGQYDVERFAPDEDYFSNVNERLEAGYNASKDAIESLQVLKSYETDLENTNELVARSQASEGSLQAIQAQNQLTGQLVHEFKKLELLTAQGVKQHAVAASDENMKRAQGHSAKDAFWGDFIGQEAN